MHYIGLDLAWGYHNPTGIAVLDDAGRLVHVEAALGDDEIYAAIAPYAEGECVVAIDAPLIVKNAQGSRPAERELNKDFAKFDAGAHPANTGKPEFAQAPRGAQLSARLGLDLNPDSRAPRRAIEVYPHPATVVIFALGRTLKYKQKRDRTFAQLKSELRTLTHLLEGLATADPPLYLADHDGWRALVQAIDGASRKSELRRVEDQVDAVVCAYVALYREHRPAAFTTYGDYETGYIVTPTLPGGHGPSPRTPWAPPPDDAVRAAVRDYAAVQPALREAADDAVRLITNILDEAGINYLSVAGRAKSVASFAAKATRTVDGRRAFTDPMSEIGDTLGVRVITYVHRDVASVAALLADELVVHDDRDLGQETASEGRFGYASRHLQVGLDADVAAAHPSIGERQVQVQIRTVLQHAWAEFEHDIRYKGSIPDEHRPDFDRRFTLAAGLLELADRELSTIRDRLQAGMRDHRTESSVDDPRISASELAAFLAGQYDDAGWSRTDHYAWISGLVLELGITSLAELAEVIRSVDTDAINTRMGYRHPTGAVRRLDDALLAAYGERYIRLHGNAHRVENLGARLVKFTAEG